MGRQSSGILSLSCFPVHKRDVGSSETRRLHNAKGACWSLLPPGPHPHPTFFLYIFSRRRCWLRYMALLPPPARLRYTFDLYRKGGATHALLDHTMIPGQSLSAMTNDVGQVCDVCVRVCLVRSAFRVEGK